MTDERMSEEMLMAYVDHELDESDVRLIEAAAANDASIAERIERIRRMRQAVRDAYAGLIDEPVPARLEESVRAIVAKANEAGRETVVPFKPRERRLSRRAPSAGWALAACLGLVAVGIGGYLAGQSSQELAPVSVALGQVASQPLADALSELPSGDERELQSGEAIRMVFSFRDAKGTLCREFEVGRPAGARTLGVACRPGAEWQVNFAVATDGAGQGYAPASSTETLDAYLSAISAGQPLSPEEERAALRSGR